MVSGIDFAIRHSWDVAFPQNSAVWETKVKEDGCVED